MLIRLFRSNQPVLLAPAVLLVALLFAPALWKPLPPLQGRHMPLFRALVDALAPWPMATAVLTLLLLMLLTIQLQRLVDRMGLFERPNHLVPLCFALLVAVLHGPLQLTPILLAAPLVLCAMHVTWRITNKGAAIGPLLDAGLLLGCAALLHPAYLFLIAVVWASVSLIRPFHWREYVVVLVGAALPFLFHWAIRAFIGAPSFDPLSTLVPVADGQRPPAPPGAQVAMLGLLLAPLTVAAIQAFNSAYQRGIVRDKNLRAASIAFLLACAMLAGLETLLAGRWPDVLAAMPFSILLAHGLVSPRWPTIAEGLVLLLAGLAAWAQWMA